MQLVHHEIKYNPSTAKHELLLTISANVESLMDAGFIMTEGHLVEVLGQKMLEMLKEAAAS